MNREFRTKYLDIISGRSHGLSATAARFALSIAAGGYALAAAGRSMAFDLGLLSTTKVDCPVISIGNLTTGGTGKTPMVEAVARHFRSRDLRVAILSRGYGASADAGMNDEGLLLDQNLPDVPHLQGADRVKLAKSAIEELDSQVLILDDGHQHRYLHRDANVVLIDATNPFGYGWTLPRGLLREPLSVGLRRAQVVVLTRCDLVSAEQREAIKAKVMRLAPPTVLWCESVHRPTNLILADGSEMSLESLAGRKVAVFCGLGNPLAFRKTVESLGATVVDERRYPDHHRYGQNDLAELSRWVDRSGAELTLTTQKDSVKLPVKHLGGRPLAAVRIGIVMTKGESEFFAALDAAVPEK